MSNHFLLEYLPSFYKRFLIDDNGDNLLNPLFDVFTNCIGDNIYSLQQYTQLSSLEKCPLYFEETYCTLDLSNTYNNGYIIDKDIISIDNPYVDPEFKYLLQSTYMINYDPAKDIKYITFDNAIDSTYNYLYIKSLKKRNNVFRTFYGKLLNHDFDISYDCTYEDYISYTTDYKNRLLSILLLRTCGPSLPNIERAVHMLIGGQFSPCNGKVLLSDYDKLIIEDSSNGKQYNITTMNEPIIFPVNTILNKYDPISAPRFSLLTLKTEPIKFIQYLLSDYCEEMMNLLIIDRDNKEEYAYLKFDNNLKFDSDLFWDMGNGTGFDYTKIPSETTFIVTYDNITKLKNWIDTRFESSPIYEMFRNILVIDFGIYDTWLINSIIKILDDLIPVYVKLTYRVSGAPN